MSRDEQTALIALAAGAAALWLLSLRRGLGWPGLGTGEDQGDGDTPPATPGRRPGAPATGGPTDDRGVPYIDVYPPPR